MNIATAFDCPFEGRVPEARTIALLERLIPMRPDVEICLCDTTARAEPTHVESLRDLHDPLSRGEGLGIPRP